MRKAWILINNSIYSGLSILGLSKIVMNEFWYDSMKPKYGERKKQNCVIWIQTVSLYTQKQIIFIKMLLLKMLKQGLILQIMD